MNKLIAYIHFLGFLPALLATENASGETELWEVIGSIIFSWGVVLAKVCKVWLY